MIIELAGVAAVGKTTVGRILAAKLNLPFYEVEARECWSIREPIERQLCFLHMFYRQLRRGPGVYSNSLLTVAAYFYALTNSHILSPFVTSLLNFLRYEKNENRVIIVLAARPETLEERIKRRLMAEQERRRNVIEEEIGIHVKAQKALTEEAKMLGIKTIWVDDRSPEDVAAYFYALLVGAPA